MLKFLLEIRLCDERSGDSGDRYTTGVGRETSFPSPEELWQRLSLADRLDEVAKEHLLSPTFPDKDKPRQRGGTSRKLSPFRSKKR